MYKRLSLSFAMVLYVGTLFLLAVSVQPAYAEKAIDNYKLYCVQCHGMAGVGKGINSPFLAVQPRNHTSAKDMGGLTDASVFTAIKDGGAAVGKSTQMPPFGGILTEAEIKEIVKHLRGMCKCEGKK